MRNVSDKSLKKIKQILFSVTLLNLATAEVMWKNTVEPNRSQNTVWSMRFACWIPKATNPYY
jgi:hypothetical protein